MAANFACLPGHFISVIISGEALVHERSGFEPQPLDFCLFPKVFRQEMASSLECGLTNPWNSCELPALC